MDCFIFCRVSSTTQEDGFSLDAQEERANHYAKQHFLSVIKTSKIIESSTRGNRKSFYSALDEVKKYQRQKKETVALIFDAVDRAQRSFNDTIILDELRKKKIVELHFLRECMTINDNASAMDLMRWDYAVLAAKAYVAASSENVKRSYKYKLENGEIVGEAPLGYLNVRDEQNKSNVIVDSQRAHLVKKLFEEYATGLESTRTLTNKAKTWGLTSKRSGIPINKAHLHRLLSNPFYYGEMLYKGKLYPHKYPPLISKALFNRCQDILHGKNMESHRRYKCMSKPFLFKGLIKCGQCGCLMTSDKKIKKSGKEYTYLFCSHYKGNCTNKRINENVILEQLADIFKELTIPQKLAEAVREDAEKAINLENEIHTKRIRELRTQYDNKQKQLLKLRTLFLDEKVTADEFREMSDTIKAEQANINEEMQCHIQADKHFDIAVSTILTLGKDLHHLFMSSKVDAKREILNFLLSNLKINDGKLSYTWNFPFDCLTNFRHLTNWRERRGSNSRPHA